MFDNMNDFQKSNPELANEIMRVFDLDGLGEEDLGETTGIIEFVEAENLIEYETMCGTIGEKIHQEAVDYLWDVGVDYVIVLCFNGKEIASMFVPLHYHQAAVFEYINNKHGSSLRAEPCANRDNDYNEWSHFESE
jgi:hypothetical protein